MSIDRYLLVRAVSLYIAVLATGAAWAWRRPSRRALVGASLAFVWNVPAVLLLHVAAVRAGWWDYDATGGTIVGMPVDLLLAWACLWGAVPALLFPELPLALIAGVALGVDLMLMPEAVPVVRLHSTWIVGDLAGILVCLLPAQLLSRWTRDAVHVERRAFLQSVAFAGVLMFVLPAMVVEASRTAWINPLAGPAWRLSLVLQLLAVPALIGLTAVQEFATRGRGTPIPFDPPQALVTSGIYAYLGNPMQVAAVILLALLGLLTWNFWISATGVVAHIYSAGLAGWDEDDDLRRRFGPSWTAYRAHVRRWLPRLRPWHPDDRTPARLYVADGCGMCREVARWFECRGVRGLVILAAETHPSQRLQRITYEPGDGTDSVAGVAAVARALEHIHLGWALAGCAIRLRGVCQLLQLLADASGAEPRVIGASLGATGGRPDSQR